MTNLKALANDKPLIDKDGNILYLKGVVLGLTHQKINESTDYDMTQLDELSIYVNPLQAEVDRLNLVIAHMIEESTKQLAPTYKAKHNHLSKHEVKEIEDMFIKDTHIDRSLIQSTYNSSQPVISRIASGIHVKSSESYKTLVMKRNLDGSTTQ